jgi:peptide chain release factor 2
MSESNFWSNQNEANKIVKELKSLKTVCDNFDAIAHRLKEAKDFVDIAEKEDDNFVRQLKQDLEKLSSDIGKLEFNTYLSGELDKNSAILSINAGAGGTESCDWANMLLRMYSRWAESKEYAVKIIDILSGDTAGIKNVTITVDGEYAYGYLKSESGVHRLVRISPFDANKRRHTSFASVDVVAQIEEDIKVEIAEKDIRIDVFRATGPGGQGVNTTDSAVRITHLPTGIVVNCQNERSQLQNKLNAMNVLRARLYEKLRKEQEDKLSKQYGAKQKIEWGSQIRSYVLHPYNMVKDHRTDAETGNAQGVLDGDLDMFIEAYLKKFRNQKG